MSGKKVRHLNLVYNKDDPIVLPFSPGKQVLLSVPASYAKVYGLCNAGIVNILICANSTWHFGTIYLLLEYAQSVSLQDA